MRKLLATVSAIAIASAIAGGIAYTSTLPLITNPACNEASQEIACLNALIQAINSGVTGNYAYVPGPVGSQNAGQTTANITFASASIPTGTITTPGQGFRARCAGIQTINTSTKFGIAIGRSMAVSLESLDTNNVIGTTPNWDLEIEFRAATSPVTGNYTWMGRGFASNTTGDATGQSVIISGNDVTGDNNNLAPIPINCVMYNGAQTGQTTMMNFTVEQLH